MEMFEVLLKSVLSQTGLIASVMFFFWWMEHNERLSDKKEFTQAMKDIASQISGNTTALSLIKEKISKE